MINDIVLETEMIKEGTGLVSIGKGWRGIVELYVLLCATNVVICFGNSQIDFSLHSILQIGQ